MRCRWGHREIALDLRDAGLADSTGLAALVRCRRRSVRLGVGLVLEVDDGQLTRVLDVTALRSVVDVC